MPKPHGAIPPAPTPKATPEQWEATRKACAERVRANGSESLAASYEAGEQDGGFAMRFALAACL